MDALSFLSYEYQLTWLAVLLYIGATIFFAHGVFFEKPATINWGVRFTAMGLFPHGAAILLRWYVSGHGPYINKFEIISSNVWLALAAYLFLATRKNWVKPLGLAVAPFSFLFLALALFKAPGMQDLPPTFKTIWLAIHILFTKLSLVAMLVAMGTAVLYLRKDKNPGTPFHRRLPPLAQLDLYGYRFCGFGFIFWTINIAAGAIWAHNSWGRYWGWDPMETWSLISWLIFGIFMHLRRFHGLKDRKAAWFMVGCFSLVIFTLFVIPLITTTIHDEFLL